MSLTTDEDVSQFCFSLFPLSTPWLNYKLQRVWNMYQVYTSSEKNDNVIMMMKYGLNILFPSHAKKNLLSLFFNFFFYFYARRETRTYSDIFSHIRSVCFVAYFSQFLCSTIFPLPKIYLFCITYHLHYLS